jgi:electron transfer flavoprotein beta subunit
MELPALITISSEYRPREPFAGDQILVRHNNYRGKLLDAIKWTADDLGADAKRLGFAGSPTIVGPGIDIGKLPVQKQIGKSVVFLKEVEAFDQGGVKYGPFDKGDLAEGLPSEVVDLLRERSALGTFDYGMLVEEMLS